ncbi:MAG: 3-deoxy-manno-octulosonate cytidylyltransferase [Ahrensia sp.]|nr:3-deoxy-manno-octulosonate cytidylyltransferase [Ahrensia sp.]
MKPLIIIPARMGSTRLPGKPLADIAGKPMIVHVADRAAEASCGDVLIAADDTRIIKAAEEHGYCAVMTRADHASGSDRIYEALENYDPQGNHDIIINVQGDLPTLDPALVRAALSVMDDPDCDIATLCAIITDEAEETNPNVVKLVGAPLRARGGEIPNPNILRALYFTRTTAPYGDGPHYHHIGLYVYRRQSLKNFISAKPSVLEMREKLEQLRALEDGMQIHAMLVDTVPLGVDTPPDLEKARQVLSSKAGQ